MLKTFENTIMHYKGVEFDDFVVEEDGEVWSQICPECASKYKVDALLSPTANDVVCGVRECHNEADHYIDFPIKT